ncbi:nitrogenase stabilizing/protective protein NifW [Uliginosibacterium sediminicola]|uniref:Nitrogenase-stabilizing/protective protein NifW n=1 Tax=Uliginosibacterium sediminicola TaxID=2024550 RepID=A0ABU9Z2F6_9RHOO
MNELTARLANLSSAEEFLDFFALAYDQSVVNVSRLHILKRFYQYLRRDTELSGMVDEASLYARYRSLLSQAYEDFVKSTPAQEKVFKVFQDTDGKQSVTLDSLRATLPSAA